MTEKNIAGLTKQVFHKGDHVRLLHDWSCFKAGSEAIVRGTYADLYCGDKEQGPFSYGLYVKDGGECAWFCEGELELIEHGREDLRATWETQKDADDELKSSLDWIFENGPANAVSLPGPSVEALGRTLGMDNLWGSHGEGFVWYSNALAIQSVAAPFLEAKDKAGWLAFTKRRTDEPSTDGSSTPVP